MENILYTRSKLAARLGFDITDYHVISYLDLDYFSLCAAKFGDLDSIKYLVARGENVQEYLCETTDLNVVEYLISIGADINAYDDLALQTAAAEGRLEMVKYLVEHGANVRTDYACVLCDAAANGCLDVVDFLMTCGADIHVFYRDALERALSQGHLNVVKYFVNHGIYIYDIDRAILNAAYEGYGVIERRNRIYHKQGQIYSAFRPPVTPPSTMHFY